MTTSIRTVNGFDINNDRIADVLDALADDIRNDRAFVTAVSDGREATAEEDVSYNYKLTVNCTHDAKLVTEYDGSLVETDTK